MARVAREKSESGIYHILLLGNNKLLFVEESDVRFFLSLLRASRINDFYELYAYAFFSESVHLVLKEGLSEMSSCIKGILSKYAQYYNKKYARVGKLFSDRFRSQPIISDRQLLDCVRFVHRRGRTAIACSFSEYIKKSPEVEYDAVMLLLEGSPLKFRVFMDEPIEGEFLEKKDKKVLTDLDLKKQIKELFKEVDAEDLSSLNREQEKKLIAKIKTIEGASIRQVARVLGISKSVVERA